MLSITVPLGSHLELIGLAAARMEVRAFSWEGAGMARKARNITQYFHAIPRDC